MRKAADSLSYESAKVLLTGRDQELFRRDGRIGDPHRLLLTTQDMNRRIEEMSQRVCLMRFNERMLFRLEYCDLGDLRNLVS